MIIIKILDSKSGDVTSEFNVMAYNIDYNKSLLQYVSYFGDGVHTIHFTKCQRNEFAHIPIIEVVE